MPHFAEPVISSWDEADNQKSDADLETNFCTYKCEWKFLWGIYSRTPICTESICVFHLKYKYYTPQAVLSTK